MRHIDRTLLLIADGVGVPANPDMGAIRPRSMPYLHGLFERYGRVELAAAEGPVGLEAGQPGNSEAGHLIIGAGRRIPSLLCGISESYGDGTWERHPAWEALRSYPRLHLLGLLSDAGVHGHLRTIIQAAALASRVLPGEVFVHVALDGVDSVAGSAPALLRQLQEAIRPLARVRLAAVMGRKWAMDRSGNLELSRHFAEALRGRQERLPFVEAALEAHLAGSSEASFPAHWVAAEGLVRPGEPVLFTNHRADRTAQLARVFSEANEVFALVELGDVVPPQRVFFPKRPSERGLVRELQAHGIGMRRVAEQCKFPHVTYFFNGFHDSLGEEAVCIPSIPEASIPQAPQMSIDQLTQAILEGLRRPGERAMVANIPNLDQVGHTGRMEAALCAAGHVDQALASIHQACVEHGWHLLFTSDHGNAEVMLSADGTPWGSHTTRPVPMMLAPRDGSPLRLSGQGGSLANVAATFLATLDLAAPNWMAPALCT